MAIIVKDEYIQIDRLELGPFGTNSYILICQPRVKQEWLWRD
jgi:hypothetical protein